MYYARRKLIALRTGIPQPEPISTTPPSKLYQSESKEEEDLLAALDELTIGHALGAEVDISAKGSLRAKVEEEPMNLEDIQNQFASLQNFLDGDLFNDLLNLKVEEEEAPKKATPSLTMGIFDQLDQLDSMFESAVAKEAAPASSSKISTPNGKEEGSLPKNTTVALDQVFNVYHDYRYANLEDYANAFYQGHKSGTLMKKKVSTKDLLQFTKVRFLFYVQLPLSACHCQFDASIRK